MRIDRLLLSIGGFAYAIFHAVLGFFWMEKYDDSQAALVPLAIYVVLAIPTILLYRGVNLPIAQAILTVIGVQLIPLWAQQHLQPEHFDDYSTWYVLGIGTLMSAVAIRGYVALAALGMIMTTVQVTLWAGVDNFFATGQLGPIMLLVGTSVVKYGLERASTETARYAELNEASAAKTASIQAAGVQRELLLRETLGRSEHMLDLIAASATLTDAERAEARLIEAGLRDEIRGRDLMSAITRLAIEQARRRGVNVTVLDEGGFAELSEADRADLHAQIAAALAGLSSGRVTVRAPRGEDWSATIAAFDGESNEPSLWLRISPNAQGTALASVTA